MIALTGNTLGIEALYSLSKNPLISSMSESDYLIVLGNCGVMQARTDFRENILMYRDLPCSVLFLDGSHDDYDLIADYPVFPWNGGMTQNISRGITHLMRGQVYSLGGKKIFTMGGSTTPGRKDIGRYYDWWPEQDIFPEETNEALNNLSKVGNKVDYVLTCECPGSWKNKTGGVKTPCSEALEKILSAADYGHWYFSDYESRTFPEINATALSAEVTELGKPYIRTA